MTDRRRQTNAGLVVTVLVVALLVTVSVGAVVLVGTAPVAAQSNETGGPSDGATTGAPPGAGPSGNATTGSGNDSSGNGTGGDSSGSDRVESALPDTSSGSGSGAGTNESSNETASTNEPGNTTNGTGNGSSRSETYTPEENDDNGMFSISIDPIGLLIRFFEPFFTFGTDMLVSMAEAMQSGMVYPMQDGSVAISGQPDSELMSILHDYWYGVSLVAAAAIWLVMVIVLYIMGAVWPPTPTYQQIKVAQQEAWIKLVIIPFSWAIGTVILFLASFVLNAIPLDPEVIASNRSKDNLGAIVYSDTQGKNSSAYLGGSEADGVFECRANSRLMGFRHRGPTSNVYENEWYSGYIPMPSGDSSARDSFYASQHARGISCTGDPVQIDNMDIFGWPTQGVTIGLREKEASPQINNCSITQCGLTSAGYGVEVFRGHPTVYQVYFNGTRHAVAGFGYGNCSYSLVECEFGPANSLFQVDQHGLYENTSGSSSKDDLNYRYRAGGTMEILQCTFTSTHVVEFANFQGGNQTPAIVIGGVPMDQVVVRGNQFSHPPVTGNPKTEGGGSNPPIAQGPIPPGHEQDDRGFCRFEIADNQYGMSFDFPVGTG